MERHRGSDSHRPEIADMYAAAWDEWRDTETAWDHTSADGLTGVASADDGLDDALRLHLGL